MSNRMILGQFMDRDSLLHQLDPRTKLLGMLLVMLGVMSLRSLGQYVVITVFVVFVVLMSKVSWISYWQMLRPLRLILFFTFLYNIMATPGTHTIWTWSWITLTQEGIWAGVSVTWRLVLLIVAASILTLTTKPLVLARGLESLLSPLSRLRVPISQISLMVVIAIRFIPTIMEELERIILAQKARGYDLAAVRMPRRLLAYIPIVIPLFMTTIQRAEQLTMAIEARAFGNGQDRSTFRLLTLRAQDFWAGGCLLVLLLIIWRTRG